MSMDWNSRRWSPPLADAEYRSEVLARILNAVEINSNGCWIWTKYVSRDGYGHVSVKRLMTAAHQVALAIHRGSLWSTDLQVDHLCVRRACCNPEHLELVTPAENTRRGYAPSVAGWLQRDRTHCINGHAFDERNTYRHPRTGHRACRACRAACEKRRFKVGAA